MTPHQSSAGSGAPSAGIRSNGEPEWETWGSAFIRGVVSGSVIQYVGAALVFVGLILIGIAVGIFVVCVGALILVLGIGMVLIGVGAVLIAPALSPLTIILVIVGVGLSIFGYALGGASACAGLP